MLSLDLQINYSVFAPISVRTHEVFARTGQNVSSILYIMSFQGISKILSCGAEINNF